MTCGICLSQIVDRMILNVVRSFFFFLFLILGSSFVLAEAAPPSEMLSDAHYKLERKVFIKRQGNKYGLVNRKGKEVLPAKYDSLLYTELQDQYIAFLLNQQGYKEAGIINDRDKKVIPIGFSHIHPLALSLYAVTDFKGSTALFNSEGKQKTAFQFHKITAFKGNLARFYKNGKAGLINSEGKVLLEAIYKDIIIRSDSTVDVVHLRNWKILDAHNKELKNLHFDSIFPVGKNRWVTSIRFYNSAGQSTLMSALNDIEGNQLIGYRPMEIAAYQGTIAKIRENNQYGVINLAGDYVLPAEFDSVALTQEAIVAGLRVGSQWFWHLFDLEGRKKSRHTYQAIVPQQDDLMPAKLNGRWGYLNAAGEEVLICRYDTTYAFQGDLARVRYNGSMGVIQREGRWQIRPSADFITIVSPTRFIARTNQQHQLLDEEGQVLFSSPNVLKAIEGGILEINNHMQYGLLDLNGKRLAPTEFKWISEIKEDEIFLAKKYGRKGILSKDGKSFIGESDKTFDELFDISEHYLAVEIDDQQGFVDTKGRLRISNRYDSVTNFSEGYAAYKLMGRWGYVDKLERLQVQPLYDAAYPFEDDMAIVGKNGRLGLINKKGEVVIQPEYEDIQPLKSGRYLIVKNGKMGITDQSANTVLSAKYDHIKDLRNGYFLVSRNKKHGLISYQGISTIPLIYDILLWDDINNLYLCSEKGEAIERIVIRPDQ